ncbi:MAG: dihydroorotase family protein, partial [Promethearchaeota archaeon]
MILKNVKIYTNGEFRKAILLIQNEIIDSIFLEPSSHSLNTLRDKNNDDIEIDCGQRLILPGIIDIHSHLRDMGQIEKETFRTGTKAAAFSGITTAFNMPNTIPPATTSDRVKTWMNKAKNNIYIDIGFIAGVPEGINEEEIKRIIDLGVIGFKIYPLKPLSDNDWTNQSNIQKLIKLSSKHQFPIFIHPDWPSSKRSKEKLHDINIQKGNLLKIHNKFHPNNHEAKFIRFILDNYYEVVKKFKLPQEKYPIIHFCHISCKESIKELNNFYNNYSDYTSNITFEVTPHHILLNYNINLENPGYGKVLPPLRRKSHSKFLFNQLKKGDIKFIATDHAPHTIEEKNLPFFEAPSGFPGFETYLFLLLDKVFRNRLQIRNLVQAATENPAKRFNLNRKGFIKE